MIDFNFIKISSTQDYDNSLKNILYTIFPVANHSILLNELKTRIGIKAKLLILEFPYRDYEFSSVYSLFYSKKHQKISKDCIRLHFFSNEEISNKTYIGNIVVRDSKIDSRGKGIFAPHILTQSQQSYTVLSVFNANIMGKKFEINTYPWMAQDTDIAVCAHVAVWSINTYFANKYPNYKQYSIGEISEKVNEYLGRKTPSNGLNLMQVSDTFSKLGYFPLVLAKEKSSEKSFFQAVYSYIESGIPMVGAMTKKAHAVAIIGHGKIDKTSLLSSEENIINIADYLDEIIISDDNQLAFTLISKNSKYSLDDLDYVIIPLYEKMYINANIVFARVKAIIESNVLELKKQVVVRIYLTSARSFKREALENNTMDTFLKSLILKLHTPKFIWCVEISTKDEYNNGKLSALMIIDSTAGTYENDPWLLMHDTKQISWKDDTEIYKKNILLSEYDIYKNNLKEL